MNYDLLGRVGCEQDLAATVNATGACSAGDPLVQNTYDTTFLGTKGSTDFPIGHLTQSVAYTYYPDATTATVTEQYQTDQRGRTLNEQMQVGVPSSWGVTTALPTYQIGFLYNDANQVTTTSTLAGSQGYTYTQVYDPTTGSLQGLSNTGNSTANLATLAYNEYTQVSGLTLLNGAASSPTSVASEQFSYDGNLRPTNLTTNWLPGSGNSGQILGQSRAYDNAGNVTSVSNTFATVLGQSGSGGAETQNFCYDEQNRLVWPGNSGTQPSAGNGTCGSGTLSNTLSGAGYTAAFAYTNLGQIWQGPLNGQGATQQYLYCNSAPLQLSGVYPIGTTCANMGSATPVYVAGYDPWGNENYRSYNGVTASLFYNEFNWLTEYNAGSHGQEFYAYDASGNRVLTRSISGSTTLTVYPSGREEYDYSGTGSLTSQLHYYSLAGHLIGAFDGTNTIFYLTDALGSVLLSLNGSAVLGEQVYGPYGNQRYTTGNINTAKGYTGQLQDNVTGLDYYNARYYDPVVGIFLSPDSVQGSAQGMNPYAYVACNPETATDPTGHRIACMDGPRGGGDGSSGGNNNSTSPQPPPTCTVNDCSVNLPPAGGKGPAHHYTLQELQNSPHERLLFLQDFYAKYAPGDGQAEEDFLTYLINSGRLGKKGGYWDTCDYDLMRDQLMAAFDMENHQVGQSGDVSNWIKFASKPSNSSWWTAHNASVDAADHQARVDGLYGKESWLEQRFIDETITVINDIPAAGMENAFSPQSKATGQLASLLYPQQYSDWSDALSFEKQASVGLYGPSQSKVAGITIAALFHWD